MNKSGALTIACVLPGENCRAPRPLFGYKVSTGRVLKVTTAEAERKVITALKTCFAQMDPVETALSRDVRFATNPSRQ
jgi:hypothetical protein